jgi:hypothetical protein
METDSIIQPLFFSFNSKTVKEQISADTVKNPVPLSNSENYSCIFQTRQDLK